jgi:hypothetical protein
MDPKGCSADGKVLFSVSNWSGPGWFDLPEHSSFLQYDGLPRLFPFEVPKTRTVLLTVPVGLNDSHLCG